MIKIILLIFIFSIATSKELTSQKFGEDIAFDKNNKEFDFLYEGEGTDTLIIFVEYNSNELQYIHTVEDSQSSLTITLDKPGEGFTFSVYNSNPKHHIKLDNIPSNGKGKLWINPLKNKISIDLNENKKYGKMFYIVEEHSNNPLSPLTFEINNASKDATFKFEYEAKNQELISYTTEDLKNPYEICHGEECKEIDSTYDFKKGESYTIKVNFQEVVVDDTTKVYILPGFSFNDKDYKEEGGENGSSSLRLDILFSLFIGLLLL